MYRKLTPIGSKVTLAGYTLDKYKRILAVVINNKNVKVNNKQLEDGMAVFYPKQSGCNEYKELEKKVQPTHKGVYGDPNFVNPWDYRVRFLCFNSMLLFSSYFFSFSFLLYILLFDAISNGNYMHCFIVFQIAERKQS